ncbi:hypothetical protein [Ramlibacter albus]|uniref:Histidine kinase n=1 Tax=Ramlibacter albus TaxID=2079448 RepID=A0A923M712_9BURK|nr:hypothetical protein [Ramlibacter albus]MBC5765150.1 hypothetical protein [Ramlibacter albus]
MPDPLYATSDTHGTAATAASPEAGAAPQPRRSRACIEAARHVVLRRLAPALKHDMVVNLQAVSMMAEMLNARLEKGAGNNANLQANIAKLNRLARDAVATCLRVSSWIDPGEDDTVTLHTGVQECVQLMAGGLNFRGFLLVNEVPPTEFEVCRGAVRTLLAGSLIALADAVPSGGELQIRSQTSAQQAVLTLSFVPSSDDEQKPPLDPSAPRIDWNEMQALAAAEEVELFRTATQVTIRLPRAVPSSPLRMAPM